MEARMPLPAKTKPAKLDGDGQTLDLDASLEEVRHFLEEGDVEKARARIQALETQWPDSEDVRYWARVLAPPVVRVRPGERGRPLDPERAWLRQHSSEYPGCWLAVHGDRLIAADADVGAVLKTVRETPG